MPATEMNPDNDIFESGAHAIVNPVNCIGVSGKGLALKFKEDFPVNFAKYKAYCDARKMTPGGLFFTQEDMSSAPDGKVYIVNMATKDHWRDPSQLDWVRDGVRNLRQWAEEFGVKSIACPALGAGLGGLKWPEVEEIIVSEFKNSAVEILVHPPKPGPAYGANRGGFRPR